MRRTCILVFIVLVGFAQPKASAQDTPAAIKPLTIGDTVPDVVLENIINYSSSSARLSDFKGKLLILDFWAAWCAACIRSFPQMDSLQKEYTGNLQILLINPEGTGDSRNKIGRLITGWKAKFPGFSLPVIPGDILLTTLFPHRILPHYVWILHNKVIATTGSGSVNRHSIAAALNGHMPPAPLKKDIVNFDRSTPLSQQGLALPVVFNSLLTRHIPGLFSGSGTSYSADSCTRRVYFLNKYPANLYQAASPVVIGNRFLIEVRNPTPFFPSEDPQWSRDNTYCYELTVPNTVSESGQKKIMLQDLNQFFSYTTKWEKRKTKCWALVRTGSSKKLFTAATKSGSHFRSNEILIANRPLSFLVNAINAYEPGRPLRPIVIDDTGITDPVNLHLYASLGDLDALRRELNKYDLDLLPAVRELDMFVITDKD